MSRTSSFAPESDDSDGEVCAEDVSLDKTLTRIIFNPHAE